MIDENKNFEETKEAAEKLYASFGEVWCPYLQEKIIFNAKGIEHLKFKRKNIARPRSDQYIRLKILKYALDVIKKSHTLQGLSKTKSFEIIRSNHRNEKLLMDAIYFEFVSVVEEKARVRVIIKKIGSAQPYFWSIIPFWKKGVQNGRKQINYGNPEED